MSTETETPAAAATPTPPPNVGDNIKAALAPFASRLQPGAEGHLVTILKAELASVDPSLLADAVRARLEQPGYSLFVKSEAPTAGSLEAIAANVKAQQATIGGTSNVIAEKPGGAKVLDLAGSHRTVEPGTVAAHEVARQQQAQHQAAWATMSPPERLNWLGETYRNSQAAIQGTTGLVVVKPQSK